MASKFMAFEGVASTSSASMENYGNADNERIEMNNSQYPNYQSGQNPGTDTESSPYGAVDEENDLNENFEEKFEKNMSYRKFMFNNCEQFKCIFGGLLLLAGSGIHVVWGIFRVFYLYNCEEENSFHFRFVIWSWYIGAIIGSCLAGYAIAKIRKGHLYMIGGALLSLSGILLIFSTNNTDIYLLLSRILAGTTQGLTYVVVIVHASENATKEFREMLMLIVGAVLNYSILLSVLAFFHTEGLFKSSVLNGIGLILFGLTAIVISTKHATETVPFILQNDGSELDAIQTVSKLKKKSIAARSVHHDFLTMKNLVHNEMESYGAPNFKKVFLPENRRSLIFCLYGRLCSVLSFNLPLIVMIMLFLRQWADGHFETDKHHAKQHCLSFVNEEIEPSRIVNRDDEIEIKPLPPVERLERDTSEIETIIQNPKFKKQDDEPVKNEKSEGNKAENNAKKTEVEEERRENRVVEKAGQSKGKNGENASKGRRDDSEQSADQEKEEEQKLESEVKKETKSEDKQGKEKFEEKIEKNHQKHKNPDKEAKSKHHNHENEINSMKDDKVRFDDGKMGKETKEEKLKELEKQNKPEKTHEIEHATPVILAHLLTFLHSRELTLVLLAWFVFGTITTAIIYKLNLKRFMYYISCVLSSVLAVTGIAHSFHFLSGILHFCLIVYFNYVTIPIDVFGHCMLAEAFPVTLKAFSVASVAIIEHTVHIIVISLYLSEWFHNSILLLMCIVAFVSHEIARNLPQKDGLTLGEAREQYQNIDLMLFNDPKSGYNQQQEFI